MTALEDLNDFKPAVAKALARYSKVKASLETTKTKLLEALRDADPELLELHRVAHRAESKAAGSVILEINRLLAELDELAKEPDFVTVLALAENLTKGLSEAKTRLNDLLDVGDKLASSAEQKLLKMGTSAEDLAGQWATIESRVEEARQEAEAVLPLLEGIDRDVQRAVKSRNAGFLGEMQVESSKISNPAAPKLIAGFKKTIEFFERFTAQQALDSSSSDRLARNRTRLLAEIDELSKTGIRIEALKTGIAEAWTVEVDLKKLAKVLGVAAGEAQRIAAVLGQGKTKILEALEALAKKLQLDQEPKSMLEVLRKGGFI